MVAKMFCHQLINRDRIATFPGTSCRVRGEDTGFCPMASRDTRVGYPRNHCEMVTQMIDSLQVGTRRVVAAGLFGIQVLTDKSKRQRHRNKSAW